MTFHKLITNIKCKLFLFTLYMITIDFLNVKLQTCGGPKTKGYTMIISDNAIENLQLIKHSDPNDLWFHSYQSKSNINIILKNHGEFISDFYLSKITEKFECKGTIMYTEIKNLIFKPETPDRIYPENIKIIVCN